MKNILIILLCLSAYYAKGQAKPFNCSILSEIIHGIDVEKQNIQTNLLIEGKYYSIVDPVSGKYNLKKKDGYQNDKILDSILNLANFKDISNSLDDSLFYLKKNNVIVDTFNFFSTECSCEFKGKNFLIVSSYEGVPSMDDVNLISVYNVDNYKGFSTLSLKHNSAKGKLDRVMFLYLVEQNKPVIKKVKVFREGMY